MRRKSISGVEVGGVETNFAGQMNIEWRFLFIFFFYQKGVMNINSLFQSSAKSQQWENVQIENYINGFNRKPIYQR